MKKYILTLFTMTFVLAAFVLPASANPICGTVGTESMPTCKSTPSVMKIGDCITVGAENKEKCKPTANVEEKCCIPPSSSVKTVSKSGFKTNTNNNNSVVQVTVPATEPEPERGAHTPAQSKTSAPTAINKAPAQVAINKMHPAVVAATAVSVNATAAEGAGVSSPAAAVAVSVGSASKATSAAK